MAILHTAQLATVPATAARAFMAASFAVAGGLLARRAGDELVTPGDSPPLRPARAEVPGAGSRESRQAGPASFPR